MRRMFVVLLLAYGIVASAGAASAPSFVGTVSFTCPTTSRQGFIWRCTWTWTSDASGDVSGNTKQLPYGAVIRADTDPSATAPTDNYDMVLTDTLGIDLLQGTGANRDTANNESTIFSVPVHHDGTRVVDLVVSNAGSAKIGTLYVWIDSSK